MLIEQIFKTLAEVLKIALTKPLKRVAWVDVEEIASKNKDKSSRVIKRKTQLDNLLRDGAISQEDYNNAVEGLQKFD